jgi:hypothetical protein
MAAAQFGGGGREAAMKTYRMLVLETGCVQPIELIAEMSSDLRAVDFARQRIVAYPRIVSIEIWSALGRLCRLQRRNGEAAAPLPVELRIVAKDALLVEGNAALGLQVGRDAGALLDPDRQRQNSPDLGRQ